MRRRNPYFLGMVVAHVDIVTAHGENVFVHAIADAVGDSERPVLSKIGGLGHYGVALRVLQPGCVKSAPIDRVDCDLGVILTVTRIERKPSWRRPVLPPITADLKNH